MEYQKVILEHSGYGKKSAVLSIYLQEKICQEQNYNRPAILICPGGGYEFVSKRESEPIALAFLNQGYQVFILDYTILDKDEKQPLLPYPLYDLANAIALIHDNSEKWEINKNQIAILGCSAGGHLCATYSNIQGDKDFADAINLSLKQIKISACILCYPVIDLTMGWPSSRERILAITDNKRYWQAQKLVHTQTPPTFIWHTVSDEGVPAQNSLNYSLSLLENGIDNECHMYHLGKHGLSLATSQSAKMLTCDYINNHVATWFTLACEWLKEVYQASL